MTELVLPVWNPPANPIHPFFRIHEPEEYYPRRPLRMPISRETYREVLLAYCRDKKTRRAIAEYFGVNRTTVDKALAGYRGSNPIPLYKIRRIYRLKHEDGMTPGQIAKRIGCSVDTVKKYLNLEKTHSDFAIKK